METSHCVPPPRPVSHSRSEGQMKCDSSRCMVDRGMWVCNPVAPSQCDLNYISASDEPSSLLWAQAPPWSPTIHELSLHSYLTWGALLASTSQHAAAVVVVAVWSSSSPCEFCSLYLGFTFSSWHSYHIQTLARALWCNYWSVHPHLQPVHICVCQGLLWKRASFNVLAHSHRKTV